MELWVKIPIRTIIPPEIFLQMGLYLIGVYVKVINETIIQLNSNQIDFICYNLKTVKYSWLEVCVNFG